MTNLATSLRAIRSPCPSGQGVEILFRTVMDEPDFVSTENSTVPGGTWTAPILAWPCWAAHVSAPSGVLPSSTASVLVDY